MRFNPGAMALTIFGWTPGLREIVAGRVLVCGCLVGVYEMWTGGCVEILDGRRDNCGETRHKVNRVLQLAPPEYAADMGGAPVTGSQSASDEAAPHRFGGATLYQIGIDVVDDHLNRRRTSESATHSK